MHEKLSKDFQRIFAVKFFFLTHNSYGAQINKEERTIKINLSQ